MPGYINLKIEGFRDTHFYSRKLESDQDITLDFGRKINNNLWQLLNRPKGTHFYNSEREIKVLVGETVGQLEQLCANENASDIEKIALRKIFFHSPLRRLPQRLYDRRIIEDGGALEKALMPELHVKRERFFSTIIEREEAEDYKADGWLRPFHMFTIAEANFARRLGYELEKMGGSGGCRRSFDRSRHSLLVNKPSDEGPDDKQNPKLKSRLKQWVLPPRPCIKGNSQSQAEVDSYVFSRLSGLNVVPPTQLARIKCKAFNGEKIKECSTQMFVQGERTMPLSEFIQIPSLLHLFPRSWMQAYFQKREQNLKETLPDDLLKRVALHCAVVEDTDCHFDNILVTIKSEKSKADLLVEKILGGEANGAEQRKFEKNFFRKGYNQALVFRTLASEENTDGQEVTLVKIDGGASNPHHHPRTFFERRFTHLFEVLPHFENAFFNDSFFSDKEEEFARFLFEKAYASLQAFLVKEEFDSFWDKDENKEILKAFVFSIEKEDVLWSQSKLCSALWDAKMTSFSETKGRTKIHVLRAEPIFRRNCARYLSLLRKNILRRKECWYVLRHHADEQKTMRTFFRNVRSHKDFKRELAEIAEIKERSQENDVD